MAVPHFQTCRNHLIKYQPTSIHIYITIFWEFKHSETPYNPYNWWWTLLFHNQNAHVFLVSTGGWHKKKTMRLQIGSRIVRGPSTRTALRKLSYSSSGVRWGTIRLGAFWGWAKISEIQSFWVDVHKSHQFGGEQKRNIIPHPFLPSWAAISSLKVAHMPNRGKMSSCESPEANSALFSFTRRSSQHGQRFNMPNPLLMMSSVSLQESLSYSFLLSNLYYIVAPPNCCSSKKKNIALPWLFPSLFTSHDYQGSMHVDAKGAKALAVSRFRSTPTSESGQEVYPPSQTTRP
jgi:hypothetical protein